MCSTYTSLDVLVVGMIMVIQLMLFSLLSIASEFIMISLIEKTLLLSVLICTRGQFEGKIDFSEKLPEVPRKVYFHLVINLKQALKLPIFLSRIFCFSGLSARQSVSLMVCHFTELLRKTSVTPVEGQNFPLMARAGVLGQAHWLGFTGTLQL